mmetsp:Transcript_8446/g.9945  ORF Transcript_8446/g.9945 Transcript_8446/m.9945 type:complete len:181 (-) Transcript_8446:1612-2154(-)
MSFLQRGLRLTIRQTAGLRAVKASPAMSLKHRLLSTSANARARPLVSDVIANVTFVNYKGERQTLAGLEGQSLVEVCSSHDKEEILEDDGAGGGMSSQIVQSETWTEDVYGEGATSNQSHVIIPPEWYAKLPEPTPQESGNTIHIYIVEYRKADIYAYYKTTCRSVKGFRQPNTQLSPWI